MEIPKLKLPPKDFSQISAYRAILDENTFAGKMRSVMRAYEEEHKESGRYDRIVEESKELCKPNEELAEEWHRAWFEWVCSLKS